MLAMTSVAFAQSDEDVTAMRLTFNSSATIVPDGLSEVSAEGTVGVLDGREAIVVDLGGSIGKVAIATLNAGATNTNDFSGSTYNDYNGDKQGFSTISSGLTDGWYVPTKDEMEALMNRLTWNTEKPGPWYGGTKPGAEIDFGSTSLFLPAAGYYYNGSWRDNYGTGTSRRCVYWTSTTSGTQAYRLDMTSVSREMKLGNKTIDTPIRPFHALPKITNLTFAAPVEREHLLEVSSITNTSDGIRLTVDGKSVEYPFEMLKEMTFINGTPTVTIKANQDPDNAGNYYTTFYSGLEAYVIPDGVTAYTAKLNGDVVELTAVTGGVLPRGEAVLLYSKTLSNIVMQTTDLTGSSSANEFSGVDVSTAQDGENYMLSYGQRGLAFYKMGSSMKLAPNKAYIAASSSAKAINFMFSDDDVTAVDSSVEETTDIKPLEIYTLEGVRLDKLQKGINIVNGKTVYVK